ncbi:MAG: DMT family transporter [Saprospiraceae bacterium]|nr:DMT family transporter [Saprospiraceae bacterium]
MNKKLSSYLQLHTAVLLFGLTAILGDLISITAFNLVWWRVLITSLSLLLFIRFGTRLYKLGKKTLLIFLGIGVIVAVHWVTFYGAIKFSNASVVLAAMATASLFTSLIEPLITGKKFSKIELLLGLMVIPPMLLIANNIDLSMQKGLWIGLLSALLASIFACYNKKYVHLANSTEITFLEITGAFLFLTLCLPFIKTSTAGFMPTPSDWFYLMILALACTTLAYVLSVKALRHLSAFDANLVVNLEPVYGILLAVVILKEHQEMSPNFYWGMVLIMLIVFSHPIIKKRMKIK